MKSFIVFCLMVTAVPSFAACESIAEAIDDLIESEIQTNNNLIGYLNSNTEGWNEADSLVRNGDLTRRNYNGAMRVNAERSNQNANAMRARNNMLRDHGKAMKAELARCIAEAKSDSKSE